MAGNDGSPASDPDRAVARNSGPCALNLLWGPPSVGGGGGV